MKNRALSQTLGLFLGLFLFVIVLIFFNPDPSNPALGRVAAIVVLMAVWWISEALPLAVTSFIPMVLFPLWGIQSSETTASAYMNSVIFLYIGGCFIAVAMEKWNLHKRISLLIIDKIGTDPQKLILGFMTATTLLSMWISNTATAVMMLPIGIALIKKIEEEFEEAAARKITIALLLGIAYGASIGGIGTLIGSPTNLVFIKQYSSGFPNAAPFTFSQWIVFGVPISLMMLLLSWFFLVKVFIKVGKSTQFNSDIIKSELKALGKVTYQEKIVIIVGSMTALLWIFRKDINIGIFSIPGWSTISSYLGNVDDSTVAVLAAIVLFAIPSKAENSSHILDAKAIKNLPWDAILLFGGGFAIADGFTSSGLTKYFANQFVAMGSFNIIISIILVTLFVSFVTELVSNIATVQMFLPVISAYAISQGIHPLVLMLPATLISGMAFLLPIGTPPNAVIFGSGRIKVADMIKYGWIVKLVSIIVVVLFVVIFFEIFDVNIMFPLN